MRAGSGQQPHSLHSHQQRRLRPHVDRAVEMLVEPNGNLVPAAERHVARPRTPRLNSRGDRGVRAECDVEVRVQRCRKPRQQRHGRRRPARLQARQLRLGHASPFGKLSLGQTELRTPVVHHLAKQQRCTGLLVRRGVLISTGARPANVSRRHRPHPISRLTTTYAHTPRSQARGLHDLPRMPAALRPPARPPHPRAAGSYETRQQHLPRTGRQPVADPHGAALQMETHLAGLTRKVPRVRLPQRLSMIGEDVRPAAALVGVPGGPAGP